MEKGEVVEVVLLDKDNNVLVDAKEFGLDVVKANTIQETFFVKQEELKGFQDSYLSIIKSEITDELSEEAKALRNKLVKYRTGVDKIHAAEKSFYLQAGKFVDALKHKIQAPGISMETNLKEIEDHQKNIEKAKLEKLQQERESALAPYVESTEGRDLCSMDVDVWEAYLFMQKTKFEKAQEEEKALEAQRQAELAKLKVLETRRNETRPYANLKEVTDEILNDLSDEGYETLLEELKALKVAEDKKQADIVAENERLKAIQAEKDKEAEKLAKIRSERTKTLTPYAVYIRDWDKTLALDDKGFEAELKNLARAHSDQVAFEKEKADAQYEAMQKKLAIEAEENRLAISKKLEEDKIAEEKARVLALSKKSEGDQIKAWIDTFELPKATIDNDVTKDITERFEGFVKWAKGLV